MMVGEGIQGRCQGILLLHGLHDLLTGELVPGGGDDDCSGVLFPDQLYGLQKRFLLHAAGTTENNGSGVLNLVIVELAKVLHIDLYLGGICHSDQCANLHIARIGLLYSLSHIRELAHAGWLDDDPVRMVNLHDFLQSLTEVAYQGTADAAGIHLGDLDACLLEETTVNADLAKFVFNEDDLLSCVYLTEELFDQCGLAGAKKAGENINFCHNNTFCIVLGPGPIISQHILYHTNASPLGQFLKN